MLIGVDIGGTFTDLVVSENGTLKIHKLLSTPHDPAIAMLAGLQAVGANQNARVSHGSTVATNAILERKGAKTALITTQGFRDVLEIGRQNRPELYALHPQISPPLIPRKWRYEVPERLDFHGEILTPLDEAALDKILDKIALAKIEAVAVCLLYSFQNPIHEQRVRTRILEKGILEDWQISLSCEVLPEFREYERTSTVALDAYVRPVMSRYLLNLENQLPQESQLRVMKSDGGVVSVSTARQQAIQTALSGPAAGVIGAFFLGKLAGYPNIITLDMGGTSTDVALCPGSIIQRPEAEIDGLPLRTGIIDIETVGAGGGSVAWQDSGGALRVGPQSAGANPGPIIYGNGGQNLTVSDANAILGRLDPDHFLGGSMPLNLEPALKHLDSFSRKLNLSPEKTALGIIEIANVNIDRAIRRVSIARGYDPREFTLMAFGGAGALHACEVADRLQISRVLIPRYPGVLCALGLLVADVQRNYRKSILQTIISDTSLEFLQAELIPLQFQAERDLREEGIARENMLLTPFWDMRYAGQSYEIPVEFSGDVLSKFHTTHHEKYGYARDHNPVEVVNLRLQAVGITEKPEIDYEEPQNREVSSAIVGKKHAMTLYDREKLFSGAKFKGEALIFQLDSTIYIPSGWKITVDGYRNLILEKDI